MRRPSAAAIRLAALIAGLLFAGWLAWPASLGGQTSYVVTHGVSMEPRFHSGDLAILRPTSNYRVGQVVAYRSSTLHTVVMHRIVRVRAGHYTFKGDNNTWIDPDRPTKSQLVGALVLRIPNGGAWLRRLTAPPILAAMIAFLLLAGGGTVTQQRRKRRRRRTVSRHAKAPSTQPLSDFPPTLRSCIASAAAVGLLALAVGGYAWTTPATAFGAVTSTPHRSMAFSYSAPVRKTAAYDSTKVTAPDPVFRKVTNDVTVQYHYRGTPGTIAVAVQLSAASGWRYDVPVSGPTPIKSTTYDGRFRLHLNAFEARALAAERVTGVGTDPLTLTVIPTVSSPTDGVFAPKLALTLSPLELSLATADADLTITDTTSHVTRALVSRKLTFAGHSISISMARIAAAAILLLALIAVAVLVWLARQSARGSEATKIRRRYGALIVNVTPTPTPPGAAVVDVDDFPTLARIAERYGLLVMYWRRSGVDTFVVHDETTTYRYRAGSGRNQAPAVTTWEPVGTPMHESAI